MTPGRRWVTVPLERPFGRGINLQITVDDTAPILASLDAADWPLFLALEEIWYRAEIRETGVRQFLVQDPVSGACILVLPQMGWTAPG